MERKIYPMYFGEVRAPFASANVVGPFVYCSGANGLTMFDPEKRIFEIAVGDIEAQTEVACQKIQKALDEAGASFEDIFYMTRYVRSAEVWEKALPVVRKYMPVENISATRVVVGLAHKDMLLELEVIALKKGEPAVERKIYPMYYRDLRAGFARSNVVGPFVYCSGAGGLTMFDPEKGIFEIAEGDIEAQTEMACQKIQKALDEAGTSFENIFRARNYVRNYEVWEKALPVVRKYMPVENISSTMVCAGQALESMLIEIEVIALKP